MLVSIWIFIVACISPVFCSVPVISFQENGEFSDATFLKYKGKISEDSDIRELSLCLRFSVFHLRGRRTTFVSYGDIDSPDALVGYIQKKKFNQAYA